MHQKICFLTSTSLAVVLGIAMLAGPAAWAQELYFFAGQEKITSSGTWKTDYPIPKRPEIESTETIGGLMFGPGLGAKGLSTHARFVVSAGVEDDFDGAGGYVDLNENGMRDNSGFPASSDLLFDIKVTYEETARVTASSAVYYSFGERFHPYLELGGYYAFGSEVTASGSVSGRCTSDLKDSESQGTTVGLMYGAGMLVNLTKRLSLIASYSVHDNVDFDFKYACDGETHTVTSFDSKLNSYGLSLAYSF